MEEYSIIILCRTQEEYVSILKIYHGKGYQWHGRKLIKEVYVRNMFALIEVPTHKYETELALYISANRLQVQRSSIDYALEVYEGYRTIEAHQILKKMGIYKPAPNLPNL